MDSDILKSGLYRGSGSYFTKNKELIMTVK